MGDRNVLVAACRICRSEDERSISYDETLRELRIRVDWGRNSSGVSLILICVRDLAL